MSEGKCIQETVVTVDYDKSSERSTNEEMKQTIPPDVCADNKETFTASDDPEKRDAKIEADRHNGAEMQNNIASKSKQGGQRRIRSKKRDEGI